VGSCVVAGLDAVTEVGDAWAGGDDMVAEVAEVGDSWAGGEYTVAEVTEIGGAWAGGDDTVAEVMAVEPVVGRSPCVERCGGAGDSLDAGGRLGSVGGMFETGGRVVVLAFVLFRL